MINQLIYNGNKITVGMIGIPIWIVVSFRTIRFRHCKDVNFRNIDHKKQIQKFSDGEKGANFRTFIG